MPCFKRPTRVPPLGVYGAQQRGGVEGGRPRGARGPSRRGCLWSSWFRPPMMAMRGGFGIALMCVLAHHAAPASCFSGPLAGRLPAPGRPLRRACVAAPRMTAPDESSPFFTLEEVNAAARATGKCCHGMPRAGAAPPACMRGHPRTRACESSLADSVRLAAPRRSTRARERTPAEARAASVCTRARMTVCCAGASVRACSR